MLVSELQATVWGGGSQSTGQEHAESYPIHSSTHNLSHRHQWGGATEQLGIKVFLSQNGRLEA